MVRAARLELARHCCLRILSPLPCQQIQHPFRHFTDRSPIEFIGESPFVGMDWNVLQTL